MRKISLIGLFLLVWSLLLLCLVCLVCLAWVILVEVLTSVKPDIAYTRVWMEPGPTLWYHDEFVIYEHELLIYEAVSLNEIEAIVRYEGTQVTTRSGAVFFVCYSKPCIDEPNNFPYNQDRYDYICRYTFVFLPDVECTTSASEIIRSDGVPIR